ncbi:phosphatase domain-containing protein [Bacillus altitudinis]|uniref:phosphatase domain-containing protein n=1 Tax=Bacillus altitudinis TaxID=293387 RepID=UPI00366BFDB9
MAAVNLATRKIVVVDIDGTVAEAVNRLHLLPPPGKGSVTSDWDEFNLACDSDEPIREIIALVEQLSEIYDIAYVTGRCEICLQQTLNWVTEHINVRPILTLMRGEGDNRPDAPVKVDLLEKIGKSKIAFALEDKVEVARAFRAVGVVTMLVREYENPLIHQK